MISVTKEEMKRIDSYTCCHVTPSIELMERAGKKMAECILKEYTIKRALILCGSSGNGGDAFVVGRYLREAGVEVDAFLISTNLSQDCLENKNRFTGDVYYSLEKLDYDVIIDGLIGFGLSSPLRDEYIKVIELVNQSTCPIVSLDIPTGIDGTSGISYGAFIKSDVCITVEYPKTGLFLNDGLDSYKKLEVISIGIVEPKESISVIQREDFLNIFPPRLRNTNKGSYGRAASIGGSYRYPGASLLCYSALDQFQMGIGYSYLYVPEELYPIYALRHPEIICNTLPSIDGHIDFKEESLQPLLKMDSISIGMGMDISLELYKTIVYLLEHYDKTLIIDADGLNTLAKYGVEVLKNKACEVILTPHIKEMERLTNTRVEEILKNPLSIAKRFAEEYDVTVVLKSASTIIANKEEVRISSFGNSGLAKGGSGDTLSGIMAGVCAYLKKDCMESASLATYILGRAAELANKSIPLECMRASDVSNEIKNVIKELKNE